MSSSVLPILQRPDRNPAAKRLTDAHPLYRPVELVTQFDDTLRHLVDQMDASMMAAKGIGIAAPQVGSSTAVFILDFPDPLNHPRYKRMTQYAHRLQPVEKRVYINPYITLVSLETVTFWHACLSGQALPRGKVASYEWIEFVAQDMEGRPFSGRLENMAAIIFQHEFCHLLGLMYYDQTSVLMETEPLFAAVDAGEIEVFATGTPEDSHLLRGYHVGETLLEYQARLA